ncbi:MAG: T9SS type A sorting domain-containing protein [Lewinellaceae bacterium]|nr:T9SS type A sorting domain-containing protein [Saprospiraceae bacterium]MCB9354818.1 T9SS type A sorting domain-containing protein [Lewinellaceae bacterium]
MNTTVDPASNDLSISWSGAAQLPGVLNPVVTTPGFYSVFLLDSVTGCWGSDTVEVEQDGSIPVVSIVASDIGCDPLNDPVTLSADVTGGIGNFLYSWSTGETTQSITLIPGDFSAICVTVTSTVNSCTAEACWSTDVPGPLEANITYNNTSCFDSVGMFAYAQGGVFPYTYTWNTGESQPYIPFPVDGIYIVTVVDSRGCSATANYVVENSPDECGDIEGNVYQDWNGNCSADAGEEGFPGLIVRVEDASGNEYFAYTDVDGYYSMHVAAGDYTVSVIAPNNLWESCPLSAAVSVAPDDIAVQDFHIKPLALCPAMTIDITSTTLRRCFHGTYSVQYCNEGTQEAADSHVEILLDPFLSITDSSIPYTDLGNNLYSFDLGTVQANECGNFWFKVYVSCDAALGQTHCVEGVIYPTGSCEPVDPLWSGASLQIEANCGSDTLDFIVRNTGTGSMSGPLEYVIIEDAVMLMQAPPPAIILAPDDIHHIKVPANGSTWRLEVEQELYHPGNSQPSLAVEGCTTGAQFSLGYVSQFPADDNNPWVDIDCRENVGSYDPNAKDGLPKGYDAGRYIEPGTDIEYTIHFQNTGTDTAFTVVVRDELSSWLDAATIVPGASSHPYKFDFYGDRNIKFVFDNIQLPDSSKGQDVSQGYVSFRISQKAGVPLETKIENQAAIFFDFNEPIFTNTTLHRVGKDFVTVSAWQPFMDGLNLRIMPNPVAETAVLEIDGLPENTNWQVELLDLNSRLVQRAELSGTQWYFERGQLPAGVYMIRISTGQQILGAGKLILR